MRFLRAFFIALFTAVVGCVLAFFVGDYLTRLAHVPEMEGQRGMTIVFLCAPLGILAGLIIGIISSILVRRQGPAGFLVAQGWSLLILCGLVGLLVGVPYVLSDKPPRIDGKRVELQFELRAPVTFQIPKQPDGYSIRVSLYTDNQQSRFAFIDWSAITKDAEHNTIPGNVRLLTHSKTRALLASIGNEPGGSQFIELKIPPAPGMQDESCLTGFSPRNGLTSVRFLSLNDLPRDIMFAWLIEPTATRSERTPGS
jgi:xanthosine utilization system XapX-like protein